MRRGAGVSRYCRTCGKSVPGLDHHCAWLNTCVGARNYAAFATLAFAAAGQHAVGLALAVAVPASLWAAPPAPAPAPAAGGAVVGPAVYGAVVGAVAVAGLAAFGTLASFHAFLLYKGLGTFDWMVERAAQWQAADDAAQAAAAPPGAAAAVAEAEAPAAAAAAGAGAADAAAVTVAADGLDGNAGGSQAGAAALPAAAPPPPPPPAAAAAASASEAAAESAAGLQALAASRSRVLACEPGGSSGLFRSATVTAASGDGAQRFDEYR